MNRLTTLLLLILLGLVVTETGVAQTEILSVPDTRITMSDTLVLPVYLNLDGNSVNGISAEFSFDDTHFTFLDDNRESTISDTVLTAINVDGGSIFLSLASVYPIDASGVLIYLTFIPVEEKTSQFVIESYRLDEGDKVISGTTAELSTEPENTSPFIIEIPDTLHFKSGDTLFVNYDGMFGDLEDAISELTVEMTIEPEGISFDVDPENYAVIITSPAYTGEATLSVKVTDPDGAVLEFSIIIIVDISVANEWESEGVMQFKLHQNYPNPFNPSTVIRYELANSGSIQLTVYDLAGRKITELVNAKQSAGSHTVHFDASGLSSGIYFYQIRSGSLIESRKMMLIK